MTSDESETGHERQDRDRRRAVRPRLCREREAPDRRKAYDPADEHDACGVGLVAAIDGKPRREVVEARHRRAEGRVAPRRRRCRRQDRRRRRHPCRHPAGLLRRRMSSARATTPAPEARRGAGLPAAHRSRRAGALPHHHRERDPALAAIPIYGWRQVPVDTAVIGEKANATRPEIEQIMFANARGVDDDQFERDLYVIRRRIEKRVLAENDHRLLHLLAVVPLDHLQGHVPRRAARGVLSRPEGRARSSRPSRSTTSAIRPTPSRPGGWPSRSASSPITARSTRCTATSTG